MHCLKKLQHIKKVENCSILADAPIVSNNLMCVLDKLQPLDSVAAVYLSLGLHSMQACAYYLYLLKCIFTMREVGPKSLLEIQTHLEGEILV